MNTDQDNCHFVLGLDLGTKFLIPVCILENSSSQKLGVTIDRKLNFNELATNLCDEGKQKNSSTRKNFSI